MAKQRRSVYPVAGRWIPGIPAAHLIADRDVAARLVRTGAFTHDSTGEHAEPLELTEEQVAHLDHYDNVPAAETAPEPDETPDADPKAEAAPAE